MVDVTSKKPSLVREIARDWVIDHRDPLMKVSASIIIAGLAMVKLGQRMGRHL